MSRFIVYINATKTVNIYELNGIQDRNSDYIKAFSINHGRILTFRRDRILKYFLDEKSALDFFNSLTDDILVPYKEKIDNPVKLTRSQKNIKHNGISICFTGFKKDEKAHLIELVRNSGLNVVTDVGSNTDILVACQNSKTIGKKKLLKAQQNNIKIIFEGDLLYMLDTGEIPETNIIFTKSTYE